MWLTLRIDFEMIAPATVPSLPLASHLHAQCVPDEDSPPQPSRFPSPLWWIWNRDVSLPTQAKSKGDVMSELGAVGLTEHADWLVA